jgi:hypothetical protein
MPAMAHVRSARCYGDLDVTAGANPDSHVHVTARVTLEWAVSKRLRRVQKAE